MLRNSISILVDEYHSSIERIHNCWNLFGKVYAVSVSDFLCNFFSCSQQLKTIKLHKRDILNPPMLKPREKTSGPWNTHKTKCWTNEILMRNRSLTHGTLKRKKCGFYEILTRKKNWTREIPTRRDATMALYPRDARWYETHKT